MGWVPVVDPPEPEPGEPPAPAPLPDWAPVGNVKGPAGPQGNTGPVGPTGTEPDMLDLALLFENGMM